MYLGYTQTNPVLTSVLFFLVINVPTNPLNLRQKPGVTSSAAASHLPLSGHQA